MNPKLSQEISFFSNTFDKPQYTVRIDTVLEEIKTGKYKEVISQLRKVHFSDIDLYRKLKSELPAVTFSGIFINARTRDNLAVYTSIIILDIDNLIEEKMESIVKDLLSSKFVYCLWRSPSNIGLKILIVTDAKPEEHKLYFSFLVDYFKTNNNVEIDKSGSDITRLCYVSYDQGLAFNESFITLTRTEIEDSFKNENEIVISAKPIMENSNAVINKIPLGYNPIRSFEYKRILMQIIKYLKAYNKSITANYDSWFRVALALSNSFKFEQAEHFFLQLCRLDGNLHDEYKSKQLIRYCFEMKRPNEIQFKTIIYFAQQEGFDLKWKQNLKK